MEKVFLKLDGVRGASKAPRHVDEIEIYSFSWGAQDAPKGGRGRARASTHDLTIYKPSDNTTQVLKLAARDARVFANATLTVETVSPSGGLLRSMVIKLQSVVLTEVITSGSMDTVGINFQGAFVDDPKAADQKPSRDWDYGLRLGA